MSTSMKIMVGLAVVYVVVFVVIKYLESRVIEPIPSGPLQVITDPETDPGTAVE